MEIFGETAQLSGPLPSPRITVEFDGLMVGWYNNMDTYELGVLPATGHSFSIKVQDFTDGRLTSEWKRFFYDIPYADRTWQLELASVSTRATIPNRTPIVRTNTPSPNRESFSWVLDLEGDDFPDHPKQLTLKRGLLSLILQVKFGDIYNHGLSSIDIYKKSRSANAQFGAVSTGIKLLHTFTSPDTIILNSRQGRVFEIGIDPARNRGREIKMSVHNLPAHDHVPRPNEPSHFQLYYLLFDVPAANQYDFYDIRERNNSSFDMHLGTGRSAPNPYKCGIGHLGSRSTPLE